MYDSKLDRIWYGCDYNPDQWPREIWREDMRLFQLARLNTATLPVFSWAKLQPSEEEYNFEWLDEILNLLAENGTGVCLATSTGAHPAWMARRYPDILRTDFSGRKHLFGQRQNSCPNSPTYRKFAPRLAEKMAQRYHDHPALIAWHVSNEYGGYCYCENCARSFRGWLRSRYGSLDELNARWSTAFWGHTIHAWDDIVPPNLLSEHLDPHDETRTAFQSISLDYNRFMSESLLDMYRLERDAIRRQSSMPITTNFMRSYKPLDYRKWAAELDFVSWDSYPSNREHPADVALWHTMMRSLKNGVPFVLMEQTPSHVNWHDYNALKRPGVMRLWSYQALAHGADGLLFFQFRQSVGASEKFHGAVISHAGNENTRVFREVSDLGRELVQLGDQTVGTTVPAHTAILFDWENWWALEFSSGPSKDLTYLPQIEKFFRALWEHNIPVDIVFPDSDLDGYTVVITPSAYMLHPGQAERLRRFVTSGGTLITSFFSGIVDENDRVRLGGYPADLRDLLGIWIEEQDPMFPDTENAVVIDRHVSSALAGRHRCGLMCEILHSENAEVVGTYEGDFYAGTPALTRNRFGDGVAWYIGSDLDQSFLNLFLRDVCREAGVTTLMETPAGVEVTRRVAGGSSITFILNHNRHSVEVSVPETVSRDLLTDDAVDREVLRIPAYGVAVLS